MQGVAPSLGKAGETVGLATSTTACANNTAFEPAFGKCTGVAKEDEGVSFLLLLLPNPFVVFLQVAPWQKQLLCQDVYPNQCIGSDAPAQSIHLSR